MIFSNLLNYLLYQFPVQTKSIFIGLILGSVPSLLKEVNEKTEFKPHYFLYTVVAFISGILLVLLEKNISNSSSLTNFSFLYLALSGFAMSVGVIVPGVSSTIILMLLNVYPIYLSSVSSLYFPVLIPLGVGLVLGCIICMKMTKFFFEHFYAQTFYTIIGFSIGSIFVLMPNVGFNLSGLISFLCIWFGFMIAGLFKQK